jgi:hypothetical protein
MNWKELPRRFLLGAAHLALACSLMLTASLWWVVSVLTVSDGDEWWF